MRRRTAVIVAAAVAVPVALALALLAVDVFRVPHELSTRDSRFEGAPRRQAGLWDGLSYLPGKPASRLLEVEDDLEYRRAAGLYLRAEPGKIMYEGFPELESLRAKAQFELTRLSQEDPDLKRRAQLLVLFGIMTLDTRTVSAEERENIVGRAADAFRAALELDPDNADAKHNLEMVLSIHGPIALPGNAPSQGRSRGQISGQGSTGGGY
jgi:hypothetical protein